MKLKMKQSGTKLKKKKKKKLETEISFDPQKLKSRAIMTGLSYVSH